MDRGEASGRRGRTAHSDVCCAVSGWAAGRTEWGFRSGPRGSSELGLLFCEPEPRPSTLRVAWLPCRPATSPRPTRRSHQRNLKHHPTTLNAGCAVVGYSARWVLRGVEVGGEAGVLVGLVGLPDTWVFQGLVFNVPPVAAWSDSRWCQTAGFYSPGSDSLGSDSAWSDSLEIRCYATRRLDKSSMCGLRSFISCPLGRTVCGVVSPGLGAGVGSGAFDAGVLAGPAAWAQACKIADPIQLTSAGLSKSPTASTSRRSSIRRGLTPTRRSHRPRTHPRAQTQVKDSPDLTPQPEEQ